ncbi:hypothetical protein [Geodermatophilus poikilotrophus]|uniref:Uncharacterized protein n=1 Tax=Geodermatophilus poikilotrophus TaxID=1333667 RepID=A0A1I0ATS8_9ACTN|nr:hypothetical protein [Geodermatophilus poikilotrophus]SES96960.1 hypothetical protein SAMN04488546_0934 [Geodermatophilus poikilotrophus]
MRDEELRARLTALADATAPPPRADLAAVVGRRHRARRRTQLRVGAAAAAVAAVAVAAPLLVDGEPAGSVAAVAAVPDAQGRPAAGDGPARGSLADDAAFVAAVRQLSWSDPGARAAAPPPAGSQVLFAGDVPGGRWALVSRPLTVPPPLVDNDELERRLRVDSVALAWFAGPPGASPDGLRLRSAPVVTEPGLPAALWDPTSGTLAVVAESPAAAVRVLDGNGTPVAELALTGGLAVGAAPEGTATVEVLTADGTVLASVEPIRARR